MINPIAWVAGLLRVGIRPTLSPDEIYRRAHWKKMMLDPTSGVLRCANCGNNKVLRYMLVDELNDKAYVLCNDECMLAGAIARHDRRYR